ncbi:hypothetical protein ABGV17_11125, partial [Guyparkeria sp. GHLCS8-2]|uniref:hypothetical protein n=1 Tax=Guyparkeria halopsychrophila TaxID=3139421 RepID=UPI0037CA65C8
IDQRHPNAIALDLPAQLIRVFDADNLPEERLGDLPNLVDPFLATQTEDRQAPEHATVVIHRCGFPRNIHIRNIRISSARPSDDFIATRSGRALCYNIYSGNTFNSSLSGNTICCDR